MVLLYLCVCMCAIVGLRDCGVVSLWVCRFVCVCVCVLSVRVCWCALCFGMVVSDCMFMELWVC